MLDNLTAQLANENGTKIKLFGEGVPSGQTYNISVVAENFLGYSSEAIVHQFTKEAENAPVVVFLEGDTQVDPDGKLGLRTTVKQPDCSSVKIASISYQYSVDSTDLNLEVFTGDRFKINGKRLPMRGGRTYTFTVRVTAVTQDNEALLYEATHTTVVNTLAPTAYLEAPVKSGTTDILTLSAENSVERNNDPNGLSFTWTCHDYAAEEAGFDAPCRVSWEGAYVLLQGQLEDTETVEIPAGTLSTGIYKFCVETRVGTQSDTDCRNVTVVASSPPSIVMVNEILDHNPNDMLVIDNDVCFEDGYLTIEWTAEVSDGYNVLELDSSNCKMSSIKQKDSSQRCKSVPLVCGNLQEGSKYIFGLSAMGTDQAGNALISSDSGESDTYIFRTVEVWTISAPSVDNLVIEPMSGTALQTNFELSVDGSDPQESAITYQYFFAKSGEETTSLTGSDGGSLVEKMLTPGTGAIMIVATNSYGLFSVFTSVTFVVDPFNEADVDVTDLASGGEPLNMLGMLLTAGLTDPVKQAELASVSETASQSELSAVTASDPTTGLEKMGKAASVTNGAVTGAISEDTLNAGISAANEIASGFTAVSKKRRRKRAVSSGDLSQMSESDAETLLAQYDLVFRDVDSYDDVSAANSANFFSLVEDVIMPSTCRDRVIGEDAIEVDSDAAIVRIFRSDFVDVFNASMAVSCDSCSGTVNKSATFEVGSSLEADYGVWTCDSGVECEGVCLASIQMPQDLRTASTSTASPLISNRRSDVIGVFLINPTTEAFIEVNLNASSTIDFNMPITGEVNLTLYSLECRQWVSGDWSVDNCVSNLPEETAEGTFVLCQCTSTGYLAVFEGEVVEDVVTTAGPTTVEVVTTEVSTAVTTQEATTATTSAAATTAPSVTEVYLVDAAVTRVSVEFSFNANYSTVVTDKTAFINHIKPQIASSMNVSETRLENFDVRAGSIIVSFDLVDSGNAVNEASVQVALNSLESSVQSGSLVITDPSGASLALDTSSFSHSVPAPTAAPASRSSAGTVIIVVVVMLLAIAGAVAGVVYYIMYNNQTKSTLVESAIGSSANCSDDVEGKDASFVQSREATLVFDEDGAQRLPTPCWQGMKLPKNNALTNQAHALAMSRESTRLTPQFLRSRQSTQVSHQQEEATVPATARAVSITTINEAETKDLPKLDDGPIYNTVWNDTPKVPISDNQLYGAAIAAPLHVPTTTVPGSEASPIVTVPGSEANPIVTVPVAGESTTDPIATGPPPYTEKAPSRPASKTSLPHSTPPPYTSQVNSRVGTPSAGTGVTRPRSAQLATHGVDDSTPRVDSPLPDVETTAMP